MSVAVDTKTVEMRFDNTDFEKNAKRSMSTLAKLKAALKLDGASSGLKEIEKASKKLDFKELNKNVEESGKRFSALEIIAVGALLKIGSVAAETGMRVAKSLTVDQVASGWSKYEKKVTAVQTIMANLRGEENNFANDAEKMDYVNYYLDKLTKFSDETSYSFSTMTDSVGKWIANGRGLRESVTAIQGVATWAAMAGQRTDAFARAVYNVSQAFGVGAMTTIDWKSIENANMATAQFKELAISTAVAMGKLKEGEVTIESFRESLQKKWFDNDVMMAVFTEYGEAADKVLTMATETGQSVEMVMQTLRKSTKAEDQAFVESLGFKAFEAAQAAKTFSEVIESTADAVSTKWTKIFENIFGNYQQAKELWSDFSVTMWEIFAQPLDTLNDIMTIWNRGFFENGPQNILQKWFESGKLDTLENGLHYVTEEVANAAVASDSATYSIQTMEGGVKKLIKTEVDAAGVTRTYSKLIYKADETLISGREALLQSFKNIFDTVVHDVEDENGNLESMSFFGALKRGLQEVIFGTSEVDKLIPIVSKKLWTLTIRFKELTERLKPSIETSLKIKNAFKGLLTVFKIAGKFIKAVIKPFKDLFSNLFKGAPKTILNLADSMSTWIQKLDEFLDRNKVFDTVSQKISNGLEALVEGINNLSYALTGMTIKDLAKLIKEKVFGFFENYDFKGTFEKVKKFFSDVYKAIKSGVDSISKTLTGKSASELYAHLKEVIVGFFENYDFKGAFSKVTGFLVSAIQQIKAVNTGELPSKLTPLQNFWIGLKNVFGAIKKFFSSIAPAIKWVASFIGSVLSSIANAFSSKDNADKIEESSPIWEGIKKVFKGIRDFFQKVGPTLGKIGEWIGKFFSDVGAAIAKWAEGKSPEEIIEKIIKGGFIISLTNLINSIAKLVRGVGGVGKSLSGGLGAVKKVLKGYARELNANALIDVALAIGILAGSMWVLAQIPEGQLKTTGHALGQIAVVVAGLMALKEGLNFLSGLSKKASIGKEIVKGPLETLKEVLVATVGSSIFANDATAKFVKISLGILFAAIAAKKLVEAIQAAGVVIEALADMDRNKIMQGGKIFAQIALTFGVFALLSSFGNAAKSALFAAIGAYVLVKAIGKFIDLLSDLGSNPEKMDNIQKVVDRFPKVFEAIKKIAFWVLGITAAIAIVQLVLAAFSKVKKSKNVANALKQFGKNFLRIALSLVIVVAAFALMSAVTSSMDPDGVRLIVGFFLGFIAVIGVLMTVMVGVMSLAKKKKDFSAIASVLKEFGKSFMRIALSLVLLVGAFWLFSKIKFENATVTQIGVIFGAFLLVAGLMSVTAALVSSQGIEASKGFAKIIKQISLLFLAVAVSLVIVSAAFAIMSALDISSTRLTKTLDIFAIFIVLVGSLAILAGVAIGLKVNSKGLSRVLLSLSALFLSVAIALIGVSAAFALMSSIQFNNSSIKIISAIFAGFIALIGVLAIVVAAITKSNATAWVGIAATAGLILVAAISLLIVAKAFSMIASINTDTLAVAAITFGVFIALIAILAAVGIVAGESAVGLIGIVAMAGLLIVAAYSVKMVAEAFAGILDSLSRADAKNITAVLDSLLEGLSKLVEIGKSTVKSIASVAGLAVLSIFLIALGAACILAGIGVYIIVSAFAAFADSFANLIKAIADKGPAFVKNFQSVMSEILDSIINLAPKLAVAGKVLIESLAYGIAGSAGAIASAGIAVLLEFATSFFDTIDKLGPLLMEAVVRATKSIADGVRGQAPELVLAMYDLSIAFLEALDLFAQAAASKAGAIGRYVQDAITGNLKGRSLIDYFKEDAADLAADFKDLYADVTGNISGASTQIKDKIAGTTGEEPATVTVPANVEVEPGEVSVSDSWQNNPIVTALKDKVGSYIGNGIPINFDLTSNESGGTGFTSILSSVSSSIPGLENGTLDFSQFAGISNVDSSSFLTKISENMDLTSVFSSVSSSVPGLNDGTLKLDDFIGVSEVDGSSYSEKIEGPITSLNSYTWGSDIGSQLASGLLAKIPEVRAAAENLAAVIHDILGFSEPKKGPLSDFHTYAPDMIKLWCSGIRGNLGLVESSAEDVASTMSDGMSTALDYVSGLIDNGMTDELTIRPVMDLSEIQNGVDSMGDMLSDRSQYTVSGTARLASSAAATMASGSMQTPNEEAITTDVGPTNNTFYIMNSDPDAVADRISKILANQTRRQKAAFARR